jgi:hypothetical protein
MHPYFNTAICLLIKDENDYINEWLDWHINIGFQHFYIYDNGSKIPIEESVNDRYKSYCTFIDFSGDHKNTQLDCYTNALENYGGRVNWLAFIDTDEFVRTVNGENINDFLLNYEEHDGLYVRWIIYNANGLYEKDPRPQRERFTTISPRHPTKPCGKSIIKPSKIKWMGTHFPTGIIGRCDMVDSNGVYMRTALSDFSPNDKIVIDHYFTRSYEEWLEKARRGSCDPRCDRKYDEFYLFNPDMEVT